MKKIFIIEDEILVAKDLEQTIIRAGYSVIGVAASYKKAQHKLATLTPDLILCDINLNGEKDGVDLMQEVQLTDPVPFIFITAYSDQATLKRATALGPENYLTKPFSETQLLTSLSFALQGDDTIEAPTQRELSILNLLAKGKNSRQISDTIGLSFHTIETHRKNMMKKFGVKSSAELMCLATSKKWISFQPSCEKNSFA